MSRKVTSDAVKRAIETVSKGIVKEISGIDFDTRSIVQTKRVNKFAALAESWGKEWHQCVKCKGVREGGLIASIEIAAGKGRSVEGEAHVRQARANKLGVDGWVMRERRANKIFMVIKLLCESVLQFKA